MAIKSLTPKHENKLNAWNKNMMEGHYEVISDVELDTTLYVYEPQSLAELGDDATELDYQRVWNKFNDGGHIHVFLVPYREQPEIKVQITSAATTFNGISKDEGIAAFTNVEIGERQTKRFYSKTPLVASENPIENLEIFEENSVAYTINNDSTMKQATLSLGKFEPFDGGQESYYRDVKFFYGIVKPENVQFVQVESNVPSIIGGTMLKGTKGNNIDSNLVLGYSNEDKVVGPQIELDYYPVLNEQDSVSVELTVEDASNITGVHVGNKNGGIWMIPYICHLGKSYVIKYINWNVVSETKIFVTYRVELEPGYDEDGNPWPGNTNPVTCLLVGDKYWVFSYNTDEQFPGEFTGDGQPFTFSAQNQMYPHLAVPKVTEGGVHWNLPWSWEYMYAIEQWNGEFDLDWADQGSTQILEYTPPQIPMTWEYVLDGEEIKYKHFKDTNLTGTAREVPFFLQYFTEFGLPRGLSSHGALYVNSNSDADVESWKYTDSASNGARSEKSLSGPWSTKSTMFAWDLAYDPTVWSVAGSLDIYISHLRYGAFYYSADYWNLFTSIIRENPVYDGTAFSSKIGVLSNISNRSMDRDVRKWNVDGDYNMLLLPISIIDMAEGYLDEPTFLDSPVLVGPSVPKIDLGFTDFNPASLQTNATQGFFGKYIDESKMLANINPNEYNRKILLSAEDSDTSQVIFNYYAFGKGQVTIRMISEVDGVFVETYSTTELNERAQGRNLSGGTIFTWI